jgi:hypothetical protein
MVTVTEVLDYSTPPQLAKWFKNNTATKIEKISSETASIGSLVDGLIQLDIRDGGYLAPEGNEGITNCLLGWERVKKDHPEFVPSVKEMQAEIKAFGVVGHPDFICQEPNGWGVTDLKCTSGIRSKNWVQEATYARILMAERGWPFPSFIRTIRLQRESPLPEWLEIRDPKMIQKLMVMFDGYLEVFYSDKVIAEFFRAQSEDQMLGGF